MIKFSEQSQNRAAKEMLNATQKVTNILQDNSKRGAWGEKAADDLLKSMGLIEGKSYMKQQTLPWKSEDESQLKPDFVFNIDGNLAFSHKRMIKLAYLISLWEIRIKIIFSVKL